MLHYSNEYRVNFGNYSNYLRMNKITIGQPISSGFLQLQNVWTNTKNLKHLCPFKSAPLLYNFGSLLSKTTFDSEHKAFPILSPFTRHFHLDQHSRGTLKATAFDSIFHIFT